MATNNEVRGNYCLVDISSIQSGGLDMYCDQGKVAELAKTLIPSEGVSGNTPLWLVKTSYDKYKLWNPTHEQLYLLAAYVEYAKQSKHHDMAPAIVVNANIGSKHNDQCLPNPDERKLLEQRSLLRLITTETEPVEVEVQPTCTLVSATPVSIDDATLTLYIIMVEGTLLSRISSNTYTQDTLNATCKYVGVDKFVGAGWSKVG